MSKAFPVRIFDAVLASHWAMQEEHLRALLEVAARDHGPALEALSAQRDAPLDNTARATIRDGVAVIPVVGPLFRYANLFTMLSGATSMQTLAADFSAALADRQVKAILLNVDTPGGDVNGIAEMAAMIMAARGQKPIEAYVGHLCCSGGYWLASAADKVTAAPTAVIGSIGAVMTLRDTREADAKRGIKTIEIVSSVSPDKRPDPTSDAGLAKLQAIADRLGEEFVTAVARQRGVSVETVIADFGKGGVFVGADAVKARLVDGLSSFESVLASLSAAPPAGGSVRPFTSRAAAAAQSENKPMEINTVADLEAAYPELVAQIRKDTAATARQDGHKEGHAAGIAEGATAERGRILGIQAHGVPGAEKLVADFVADGKTTPDQAGAKILAHLKEVGPRALADLRSEQPPALGNAPAGGDKDLTAADASKAIKAEMDQAEKDGQPISFAEAGARVRVKAAQKAA
jgi:signal peptide peptidase SppA